MSKERPLPRHARAGGRLREWTAILSAYVLAAGYVVRLSASQINPDAVAYI
jgi:hypothetical protein